MVLMKVVRLIKLVLMKVVGLIKYISNLIHLELFILCLLPSIYDIKDVILNEPLCEKTGFEGFRPGPTQTGLYILRKRLEA